MRSTGVSNFWTAVRVWYLRVSLSISQNFSFILYLTDAHTASTTRRSYNTIKKLILLSRTLLRGKYNRGNISTGGGTYQRKHFVRKATLVFTLSYSIYVIKKILCFHCIEIKWNDPRDSHGILKRTFYLILAFCASPPARYEIRITYNFLVIKSCILFIIKISRSVWTELEKWKRQTSYSLRATWDIHSIVFVIQSTCDFWNRRIISIVTRFVRIFCKVRNILQLKGQSVWGIKYQERIC